MNKPNQGGPRGQDRPGLGGSGRPEQDGRKAPVRSGHSGADPTGLGGSGRTDQPSGQDPQDRPRLRRSQRPALGGSGSPTEKNAPADQDQPGLGGSGRPDTMKKIVPHKEAPVAANSRGKKVRLSRAGK